MLRKSTIACLIAVVAVPAAPAGAATAELVQLAPIVANHPAGTFEFSPAGNVTGPARFVDPRIPPGATPDSSTSGCDAVDFAGFPAGAIAVIQRGACTFAVKAANAQAVGAAAVVIYNEGQPGRTGVLSGSLGGPGITIPVVGTSFAVAQQLFAQAGVILQVRTTADPPSVCDAPPAPGTPVPGKNVVVAQPGGVTVGTDGPDVIYGTAGPDRIAGLGGDDIILGFGGNDQLSGGDGADTLCGGADNDVLSGGAGPDLLSGDAGNDDLAGGAGDDQLVDRVGVNRVAAGDGTDTCTGATGCETDVPTI